MVIWKAQGESILSMGINTWEICYTLLCIAISISPASSKDLQVNYVSAASSRGQRLEVRGWRSEVVGQRLEDRGCWSEVRGQRLLV